MIKEILIKVGVKPALAELYAPHLENAMTLHGIDTTNRKSGFLAQVLHESNMLVSTTENLSYSTEKAMIQSFGSRMIGRKDLLQNPEALANFVYAGRNGNTLPGDGWKFRGRGGFQLTGRSNYNQYGYVNNPDAVAEPEGFADTAAQYWVFNGCNDLSDFDMTTRRINGPKMLGKEERKTLFNKIRGAM